METQQSINEWANSTFGKATPQRMIARAIEECSELLSEVTKTDVPAERIAEECADIIVPLCRVAEFAECDITSIFDVSGFLPIENHYSHAVRIMGRLVFVMEMLGPRRVTQKRDIERQLAHIAIDIAQLCDSTGVSLRKSIEDKLKILKKRKWDLDGNGAGYHL